MTVQNFDAINADDAVIQNLRAELEKAEPSKRSRVLEKFFLAALSVIPWVGGVLSVAETYRTEEGGVRLNKLQTQWLEEHQRKIELLRVTLQEITTRLSQLGDEIEERIQSDEYLALVRKAFRIWDESDTEENGGCCQMSSRMQQALSSVQMMWSGFSSTGFECTTRFISLL